MRESELWTARRAPCRDQRGEALGGDARIMRLAIRRFHQGEMQWQRESYGIAVEIERDGRDERHFEMAKPERRGDGGWRQHMGGVENPDEQLVAYIRPGGFAHQIETDPFRRSEALDMRHMQKRCIREWDIADAQHSHRKSSDAVMIERAISAIFFFSFIATLRIIA